MISLFLFFFVTLVDQLKGKHTLPLHDQNKANKIFQQKMEIISVQKISIKITENRNISSSSQSLITFAGKRIKALALSLFFF